MAFLNSNMNKCKTIQNLKSPLIDLFLFPTDQYLTLISWLIALCLTFVLTECYYTVHDTLRSTWGSTGGAIGWRAVFLITKKPKTCKVLHVVAFLITSREFPHWSLQCAENYSLDT